MYNKYFTLSSIIILFFSISSLSSAQTNKLFTNSNALACLACHSSPNIPKIQGMPREILLDKMQKYAQDLHKDTIMHQLLKGYSVQEIEQLAAYFSEVK